MGRCLAARRRTAAPGGLRPRGLFCMVGLQSARPARCRNHPLASLGRALPLGCATRSALNISLGENFAESKDCAKRPGLRETRPLHAHNEMIDAKQCVITLNLVLYKCLIADNETVLDEFLERLREGFRAPRLFVETPGRIGRIFVLQGGPAFFERARVR